MKVLTPWDVALRMMRNGRDPGLIVAYLEEEARRAGIAPLRLSQHPEDRIRFAWKGIADTFRPFAKALATLSRSFSAPESQDQYALAADGPP